jgi:HSP20 family protein
MPRKKKSTSKKASISKKIKVPIKKAKKIIPRKENPYEFAIISPSDLWSSFDDVFSRFRSDFEDLLFPSPWTNIFPAIPETRVPLVDLEDQGKNFLLKAEMPGFKKEDIEIDVQENSISVSAEVGWSYDKKEQEYVCKERACRSFYRTIQLPEDIDIEKVSAELSDGVLEINLPKKKPKKKRKVSIK